jgi:hypothetical protein
MLDAVHRSLGQYSALKPTQFHGRSVGTNMVLLKVSSSSGIKMNASPCRKEGIKGSGSNESLRRHRPPRYLRTTTYHAPKRPPPNLPYHFLDLVRAPSQLQQWNSRPAVSKSTAIDAPTGSMSSTSIPCLQFRRLFTRSPFFPTHVNRNSMLTRNPGTCAVSRAR